MSSAAKVSLRISMNALRTIDRIGGLDPFLLKAKDDVLSDRALRLKRQIAKKQAAAQVSQRRPDQAARRGARGPEAPGFRRTGRSADPVIAPANCSASRMVTARR